MGIDLVESLRSKLQADVVDGRATSGAGEGEGAFKRGKGRHRADMGASEANT